MYLSDGLIQLSYVQNVPAVLFCPFSHDADFFSLVPTYVRTRKVIR